MARPRNSETPIDTADQSTDARDARIAELERTIAKLTEQPVTPAPAAPEELPARKLYFLDGPWHCCGRTSPHTMFVPTEQDYRPHAFVHQTLGDHLIRAERLDNGKPRYEWAGD